MNLNEANDMWKRQKATLFPQRKPQKRELMPSNPQHIRNMFTTLIGRDPLHDRRRLEMRQGDRMAYTRKAIDKMREEYHWPKERAQRMLREYLLPYHQAEIRVVKSPCRSWSCGGYRGATAQGLGRRAYYHPDLGGWKMCMRCSLLQR